jgi:hypothetical protein
MSFSREDVEQILAETGSFAFDRVGAATARPEAPLDSAAFGGLTVEAFELGLLSSAGEGFGLWSDIDQAEGLAISVGILRQLGVVNAGVAFAWHKAALAAHAARALGFETAVDGAAMTLFAATGHFGLARTGLAKWLAAKPLDAEEECVLHDWLDRAANGAIVVGPDDWGAILWPVWAKDQIAWRLDARDQLDVRPLGKAHGFDELSAFEIRLRPDASNDRMRFAADSRRFLQRILKMEAIALLAIGCGAARHAQAIAEAYVAIRRQGGKLIIQHPAVQLSIGQIEAACFAAESALKSFERPLDDIDLGETFSARLNLHPALTEAASEAMQVHGGVGYMRDTGPEKILRDQNVLRQSLGGMRAAAQWLAAWRAAAAH